MIQKVSQLRVKMVLYGVWDPLYCYLAAVLGMASIPKVILLSTMVARAPATPVSHYCLREAGSFQEEMPWTSQKSHTLSLLISHCPEIGYKNRPSCKGAWKTDLYSKWPHAQPKWKRPSEEKVGKEVFGTTLTLFLTD